MCITELVYAWLHKENESISSYKNTNVGVEELKQQLLQDKDFMQRIKDKVGVEKVPEEIVKEQRDDRLDMDEDMMMAGLAMFENEF